MTRKEKTAPTSGDEYARDQYIYGEEMVSVDDVKDMPKDAFDAGRGIAPTIASSAVRCSFAFRSVSDILRLADLFSVPEIRDGDLFGFGISGIERIEP